MKMLLPVLLGLLALAFAVPAAADRPIADSFEVMFDDVNPCTGDTMTVTIAVTAFLHVHDGRIVARSERTITTSDGSVGHGTSSFVANGQIVKDRFTDIMTNASFGYHFRARGLFVFDVSTGTLRVETSS